MHGPLERGTAIECTHRLRVYYDPDEVRVQDLLSTLVEEG